MPAEFEVRPSLRRAKFSMLVCIVFLVLVIYLWRTFVPTASWWIVLVGVLPFLAPLFGWLDASRTSLTVSDGLVRYKHGFVNQTTRALELRKLQDVRVERSLVQRMWGIGTSDLWRQPAKRDASSWPTSTGRRRWPTTS